MTQDLWRFHIERERTDGILVLGLIGRLSRAAADLLEDALEEQAARGVVIDLERLDYISGAGLELLEDGCRRAAGGGAAVVLCGARGAVLTALELAGMLSSLPVEPDRGKALARLAGKPGDSVGGHRPD
jgi:anti-anti-sigma factor